MEDGGWGILLTRMNKWLKATKQIVFVIPYSSGSFCSTLMTVIQAYNRVNVGH